MGDAEGCRERPGGQLALAAGDQGRPGSPGPQAPQGPGSEPLQDLDRPPPEGAPFLRLVVEKPSGVIDRPQPAKVFRDCGEDWVGREHSLKSWTMMPGLHEALGMPGSAGPSRDSAQTLGAFCFPPSLLWRHPHALLAPHAPWLSGAPKSPLWV